MKQMITKLGFALMLLLLCSSVSYAQFNVTGSVKDAGGDPLVGVTISVKGTTNGTISDVEGNFSLSVPGSSATLVLSYVGYTTKEFAVSSSNNKLMAVLEESASKLEEVVITGLATSVKRSNLANAVASISSSELTGTTVQSTMDGALYGKLTGVTIITNSGAPGGGTTLKLRGITTLNGNSQPLYIVDGVYYDNSSFQSGTNFISKAAGQGSNDLQDNPSNRVADLDPEDIDQIEVLKGASAAAIYGSRAAAGVVIVTTKRGKNLGSGSKPEVSISQSIGQSSLLRSLGQRSWDDTKVQAAFGAAEVPVYEAAKAAGKLYNYEDELFGNKGLQATTRLSVRGGTEKLGYFIGVTRKGDEGIIKNTGYDKTSLRVNLDPKIFDFMDLNLSFNYVNSKSDRGFFNNDNTSTTMGVSYVSTPSWVDLHPDAEGNYPNNTKAPSNFLQTRDLITNNEKVNRILTGGVLTTRLITQERQSLNLIIRGGVDQYTLLTNSIFPRELQFEKDGNGTNGASILGNVNSFGSNIAAFLVHTFYTGDNISFRTQAGVTQENLEQNHVRTTATQLVGTQTNLSQAGGLFVEQTRIKQVDKGFFAQEEFNYQDKVIVAVGVRGDKSSRNGDPDKLYYYPKASLAINLHNFGFLSGDAISELKPRIAYGQSGNFGVFGATYSPLVPVVNSGTTGSLIGTIRGNETLGPERQTEIEAGLDLGFIKNRILLDVTYYIKNVDDLILAVDVPSSSGYSQAWKNAAAIENKGIEVGLDVIPFTSKVFTWNTRASFWFNRAKVTRLDVPAFNTGGFGRTLGTYRIEEGKSPTQLVGLGEAGADPIDPDNGYGKYGDAEPDFQLSWNNTLRYQNFELTFLWHWKKGGNNINLSTLLSDIFGTSPDFDKTSLDPTGAQTNGNYRLNTLGVSARAWIEDASYLRLREVGLYYNIPKSALNNVCAMKVGFNGRNLLNFFKYNSYDPEVSNFGTKAISSNVEVTPFPTSKTWNFVIGFTF